MKIIGQILSALITILIIPAVIFLIVHIIHLTKETHIKAEFTELAPFQSKMSVYFRGFKIGKITKIEPKEDFSSTLMHITLFPEKISFPQNIRLQIKSYKKNLAYGELVLPENPSDKKLKEGSIIEGRTNVNLNSILEKQAENGSFDLIIVNLGEITTNANSALKELDGLLKDVRKTFKNSENYITLSTKNLSQATTHLSRTSVNISSTVDQKTLDKTLKNFEEVSKNMKNITKNIDCATRNLSQTMDNIQGITENVDGITNSVNCTMRERFGGFRLFFGKTSQDCKCKEK